MKEEDEMRNGTIEDVVDVTAEIFDTAPEETIPDEIINKTEAMERSDEEPAAEAVDTLDGFDEITVDTEDFGEDDMFASLDQVLMQQVQEELEEEQLSEAGEETEKAEQEGAKDMGSKGKKTKKVLLITGSVLLALILFLVFLVATPPGRKIGYWIIGKYIEMRTDGEEQGTLTPYPNATQMPENGDTPTGSPENPDGLVPTGEPDGGSDGEASATNPVRKEEYVKNFLLFGLEEIDGASNTDTMMIASINTKDKTVKLTSVLRDMYVELDDGKGRKLNSVYARGKRDGQGPQLLMATLEKYFMIDIEGYAYVNFSTFEKIVDLLGGVTIELGKTEAEYLNTTNYISVESNRNVKPGINRLNGNQVVGYCRVRKVVTLGGATNDYGRTVRQRRVLSAIFEEYKSKNIFDLISITDKCISYVTTDVNATQIAELLEMLVENGITTIETGRIPVNDSFYDSGRSGHNGVTYGLVVTDKAANVKYLFEHVYADTPEEAEAEYAELNK